MAESALVGTFTVVWCHTVRIMAPPASDTNDEGNEQEAVLELYADLIPAGNPIDFHFRNKRCDVIYDNIVITVEWS